LNRKFLICLATLGFLAGDVLAGPLYDPFLERFQVGTYNDPEAIVLKAGFPADLLEPAEIDPIWMAAAHRVLDAGAAGVDSFLTHRILSQYETPSGETGWLTRMAGVLGQLESGTRNGFLDQDIDPLLAERASRDVFHHLQSGRIMQAAAGAIQLRDSGRKLGLSDREIFVWDLRAKMLFGLAGNKQTGSNGMPGPCGLPTAALPTIPFCRCPWVWKNGGGIWPAFPKPG